MKRRVIPNEVRDLSKGHRSRKFRRAIRAPWVRSLALLGMTAWFVWLALPKPPLLDGISFSQCVRDRNGKLLRVTLTTDQKFRVWTALPNISPALIGATLRFEDKYYRHHPGVNPFALLRSALSLRASGTHSGASTITMQLARLRYHLCTRTLRGKFVQIVRALELERHYSKAEILEAYLNLAPLRAKHRRRGCGQSDLFRQDRRAFDDAGINRPQCDSAKPHPASVVCGSG
jgi:penicillin-binding protein 1C